MNIIDYLINLLNKLLRKQSKSPVTYTSNSTNTTKSTNNTKTNSIGEYKLTTQDLTMRKGDGHTFNATLTVNGKPSVNSTIIYTINNKEYNRKTDNNGLTMLPINLNQGKYVVTTRFNSLQNVNTLIVNETPTQPEAKTNIPKKIPNKNIKGLFIRPSDTGKLSFVELKNKGYTHLFIGHMIFDTRGEDYVRKLHDKCKIIGAKLIIWYTTYYNGESIVNATSSEADKRIQTIINMGKKDIVDGVCLDYCRNNGDTVNNTLMNRISDNVNKVVKNLQGKEVYACTMFESIPALKQYYRQDISRWNCTICPMAYKYNYNYSDSKMKSMYNEFTKTGKKIVPIYQNYRGDNNVTDIGQGQLSKDIKAVNSNDYIIFRYGTGSY